MPHSAKRRVFGSLRRLLRWRRAPRPSDQEWLRLILLVRKLQSSQYALVRRFDDVRTLSGALTSFRDDFASLEELTAAARETTGELERGLEEGRAIQRAPELAAEERAAFEQRIE